MYILICIAIAPRRVPKSERPPLRPPSAYLLFFSKLVKNHKGDIKTLTDTHDLSKQAAATWNNMILAEQQVIYITMFVTCGAKIAPHSLTTTRLRS
jgi:hypothetical protein